MCVEHLSTAIRSLKAEVTRMKDILVNPLRKYSSLSAKTDTAQSDHTHHRTTSSCFRLVCFQPGRIPQSVYPLKSKACGQYCVRQNEKSFGIFMCQWVPSASVDLLGTWPAWAVLVSVTGGFHAERGFLSVSFQVCRAMEPHYRRQSHVGWRHRDRCGCETHGQEDTQTETKSWTLYVQLMFTCHTLPVDLMQAHSTSLCDSILVKIPFLLQVLAHSS